MIYIILVMSVFSALFLIYSVVCKYSHVFALMTLSMDLAVFAAVLYMGKVGYYKSPDMWLFRLDYTLFLYLSKIKISYYSITRLMNIGTAVFVYLVPIFVYYYTREYNIRFTSKVILQMLGLLILPGFYIWFYDPETSFLFYSLLYDRNSLLPPEVLSLLVKCVDIFNYAWILIYLFFPLAVLAKHYKSSKIIIKKRQIISLVFTMFLLILFFLITIVFGPFKQIYIYFFSNDFLNIPSDIRLPSYYFTLLPIVMVLIMQVMLFLILKYKTLDSVSFYKGFMIKRNIKGLNKNLRSIFHSFKNTLYTVNILAMKTEEEIAELYGPDVNIRSLERIREITDTSIDGMKKMLDSFKNTILKESNENIVSILESALGNLVLPEHIDVEKSYNGGKVFVYCDAYHMTQVVENILQNAVEAICRSEKEHGVISISINTENEWVEIKITDNGTGIKKSEQKKIFMPFYTSKSRYNNWGVGLTYAFRIVKAHLGYLFVDSKEGEYATFKILLYRAKGEGADG